jgi:hypothetical protein
MVKVCTSSTGKINLLNEKQQHRQGHPTLDLWLLRPHWQHRHLSRRNQPTKSIPQSGPQ